MNYSIGIDARFYRSTTGGLGRYTQNLLKELGKLDAENHYTVILTPEDEEEYISPGANFQKLVVDIPHYSLAEQRRFHKILNDQNFDLVHFTNFNHPILYRRPFVVTVHDLIMHLYPSGAQQGSFVRRLAYRLVMNDARRAKKVIVPSQSSYNDMVRMLNFSAEKLAITLEGSEARFQPHSASQVAAIKAKFKLPDRFLIFVSRWEKYKGIFALIEAYKQLVATNPDLGLVICGKPDKQNPEVAQFVAEHQKRFPNIITPGFVSNDDLAVLYSAATVYVHPSWYEGFGIMILEAFGAGTPVVTSNVSSLPEVVGDAGLLANPHDSGDVADKIKMILDDPVLAESLRRKGYEQVKKFSWAKMAKETLSIYREVLS